MKLSNSLGILIWVAAGCGTALAQTPPPFFPANGRGETAAPGKGATAAPKSTVSVRPRLSTTGQASCKLLTYEGLDDKATVPTSSGISSPGWVSGISVTAYGLQLGNPSGGHAQFINEPSPVTVAVFLNGSNDIYFSPPVSAVQYFYATAYATLVTAYDGNGNQLTQEVVPANWSGNPNGYDRWTQMPQPVQAPGTQIARINILSAGPPLNNFLAIDNLQACDSVVIDSVEMTQAIQQIEPLANLLSDLAANNEPPVPIISGKPGVMRVYMAPVSQMAFVNVQLTIPNFPDQIKTALLMPGCTSTMQRFAQSGCLSTDFYFTPPTGPWTATLDVIDNGSGTILEEEALHFKSRDTQSLLVRGVTTCDAVDENGEWLCAKASELEGLTALLAKIAPTNSVTTTITDDVVRLDETQLVPPFPPGDNQSDFWWDLTTAELNRMYTFVDSGQDLFLNRRTTYHGMVRPELPGGTGGQAADIPAHAAASRTTAPRFASMTETNVEVVAHETGHTLGVKHTNEGNPVNPVSPPGCYNFAADSSSPWPFNNNNIQSTDNFEVGFDVALRTLMDPRVTYEVLSYCSPRWISPQTYKTMIQTLGGGVVTSPSISIPTPPRPSNLISEKPAPRVSLATEPFWLVSGSIPPVGPPQFDPLFQQVMQGDTSGGSGTYSLELQNGAGAALFTQHFTPGAPTTETTGADFHGNPSFAQLIPVTAGAAGIVLKDPTAAVLGTITLGGVAPTVTIINPTAAFTGVGSISWSIADPDSNSFDSKVLYSPDNGSHWSEIGEMRNSGTTLLADFTKLAGTNGQGLIEVMVSDGVNTGTATSPAFSIPKKLPSVVRITAPSPNSSQPALDPVLLIGVGFDPDDGSLSGTALTWSSNLQGTLGTGSPLTVGLQPGTHIITLTATDSDNNSITASETITIGGQPPALNVSLNGLAFPPASATTCIQATISAAPGANGAPLSAVQYTLNNGTSYTNVPLASLPFTFTIPGTGFIDMVFRAYDTSNQANTESGSFYITQACPPASVPNVVGQAQAAATNALSAAGLVAGNITSAASNTVAAGVVISQNPAAGTVVNPGSSASVNLVISLGSVPDLAIAKSHAENFKPGQQNATYTVTVSNVGTTPVVAGNTVTVVDTLPAGLTGASIGGTNWSCTQATLTCTRSDTLAAGGSYPAITVMVNVAANPQAIVTNSVTVSGGGETNTANDTASDKTSTVSACDVGTVGVVNVQDVQREINEALGSLSATDDLNHDGVVNAVDVQFVSNAALGLVCLGG